MGLRVVRVEVYCALVFSLSRRPIPVVVLHETKSGVSFSRFVVNLKCFVDRLFRLPPRVLGRQSAYLFRTEKFVTVSQSDVSWSISKVFLDCAMEKTDRLMQILVGTSVPIKKAALQIIIKRLA